jgi:hypothetical protein
MRLITGRAFRKFVLLKGIEGATEGLRRMELHNRLAAIKGASNSAKEEHAAIASMLVDVCATDYGAQVCDSTSPMPLVKHNTVVCEKVQAHNEGLRYPSNRTDIAPKLPWFLILLLHVTSSFQSTCEIPARGCRHRLYEPLCAHLYRRVPTISAGPRICSELALFQQAHCRHRLEFILWPKPRSMCTLYTDHLCSNCSESLAESAFHHVLIKYANITSVLSFIK